MHKSPLVNLEDVCLFIKDGTHQTPEYSDKGYIFLSSKNVTKGVIDWDNIKYIPEELHYKLCNSLQPQVGDILLAKNGTTGIAAIVDRDEVFDVYVSLAVLRPDTDKVLPEYLLYAINCPQSKLQFDSSLKGIGVPNLHLSSIAKTRIILPSLSAQAVIARRLGLITEITNLCKDMDAQFDIMVKARFNELFDDPITNPMDWPVVMLRDVSTLITNGTTPKGGSKNYVSNGIMFLRSQNVWRNRLELNDVAYIDEATHNKMKKSSLRHNDILITKTGRINTENSSLGRAALFLGEDNSANINGHVYVVRLDDTILPEFVVAILTGESYRRYIRQVCVGGIDKRQINVNHVETFPIITPPIEVQKTFVNYVRKIERAKIGVRDILYKAETLKNSLMQKYFG